jgi:acetyl-CoA synthetase
MRLTGNSYEEVCRNFNWEVAQDFNIGQACADTITESDPDRTALIEWFPTGACKEWSFGQLKTDSDRLATSLRRMGAGPGDRLAIILPQAYEAALAHLAAYKNGMITVPLARLFAPDGLQFRLRRASVRFAVTDGAGFEKLENIRPSLPALETVITTGSAGDLQDSIAFDGLLDVDADGFVACKTGPDTPALIIFTSGTTGPPKGALHGHRVVIGHLPGVMSHHDFMPQPGDRIWSPADWAWAGGLLDVLLPCLMLGVPVVFGGMDRFDPETALRLMSETEVRNAFIPPTALRLMKTTENAGSKYPLKLRSIGTGGESLGAETHRWAEQELGLRINEFYGQTECNLVLGCFGAAGVMKSGSIGKPVPGHTVAVIDENGNRLDAGQKGQIAVKRPDPVMFLGYWENEKATKAKFIGDWLVTGDQGIIDEEGYFQFVGRDDDIINVAGYRVGPGEIEDCLVSHPAVKLAVAVGKPDELKGEVVKAYVQLVEGVQPSAGLGETIRRHVKQRLAANIFPREIEFVKEIPLTTTGKVIRRHFREKGKSKTD